MNLCEGGCIYSLDRYTQDSPKCPQPGGDEPVLDLFKAITERDDRIMIIPVSLHNEILERERSAGAPRKWKHWGSLIAGNCCPWDKFSFHRGRHSSPSCPSETFTPPLNMVLLQVSQGAFRRQEQLQPESLALSGLLIGFQASYIQSQQDSAYLYLT